MISRRILRIKVLQTIYSYYQNGGTDIADLLLIAVKPEYQNRGVNSLLFTDLIPVYIKRKYKWAESNMELETNDKVLQQWSSFTVNQNKRRRAYIKKI